MESRIAGSAASSTPAILGGPPVVTADQADAHRWPIITEEDEQAVLEVLRSGQLSINEITQALEADYRELLGVKHALAFCNGTSAILAALNAFKLERSDQVLVPSATYWASVVPVLWSGAVPVFCESEMQQLGLDPADVERRITPRTRAMIVVHLWGMPSKMDELLAIARKHDLKVFEDASHAHGATYNGKPVGTLGDAAVFSLQEGKLAPAGEGGMLVTNNDEIYEHAVCLAHYERIPTLQGAARYFAATGFGLKGRMAPLSAAVARVQLRHLQERNAERKRNITQLSGALQELGLETFLEPAGIDRVYFMFMVLNDIQRTGLDTSTLTAALKAEGCRISQPRYPLLHQQPLFTKDKFIEIARLGHLPRESLPVYDPADLPGTTRANSMLLQLPPFPQASKELLDQYAAAFAKVIGAREDIRRRAESEGSGTS